MTTATLTPPPIPADAPLSRPRWLPQDNGLQDCLHARHHTDRDRLIEALAVSPFKRQRAAASNLATCGSYATFYVDGDAGRVRHATFRCRHRLCPLCSRHRVAQATQAMFAATARMKHPRAMILTVTSSSRPLAEQLRSLRRAFARLRRSAWWKGLVAGGCYTIEVTINKTTGLWHPHLHIIFDGQFIPHKALQAHWHKASGGSKIVWLAAIDRRLDMVKELCKYIGKPARMNTFTGPQIREYARAVSGSRMMHAFGSLHGVPLLDRDTQHTPPPNEWSVQLSRILYLADHGHDVPQRLALRIADAFPRFAAYIYHRMPQLEPPLSKARRQANALARIANRAPPPEPERPTAREQELRESELLAAFIAYRLQEDAHTYDATTHLGVSRWST